MSEAEQFQKETDAYLARIRKTIADSERLVEAARLRMAETDRLLESQGLTREQVMGFRFTGAQREAVNRELARLGLNPLDEDVAGAPPPRRARRCVPAATPPAPAAAAAAVRRERRAGGAAEEIWHDDETFSDLMCSRSERRSIP